ncbi:MAG: hypothetical protein COA79_07170 [Planctomycetota bacterium]|nr:MAG: hypothetical protein COA79_07170 [Planctomycetota bacterium]
MLKKKSDIELLDLYASSKDQKYLSELFLRHSDIAFRTSRRITKNAADAEDIVQISFIEVIKTHQKFRQEGKFLSWFLKIVSHRSIDRIRSEKRRSSKESQAIKTEYYEDKTLENDEKRKQVIESYLSLLPPRYREPIYMKIVEGLSTREVSNILAKPEKTIRTQISRGLEKIKASLKTSGVTLSVLMISNFLNNLSLEAAPASLTSQSSLNHMSTQISIGSQTALFLPKVYC